MIVIRVGKNEPIDLALRRFKQKCLRSGILRDAKKSRYYMKPSDERKNAIKRAKRRRRRLPNE